MKLFQRLINLLNKFKSKQTKFHWNGKEINLTAEDISIGSDHFHVDKYGDITIYDTSSSGYDTAFAVVNPLSNAITYLSARSLVSNYDNKTSKVSLINGDMISDIYKTQKYNYVFALDDSQNNASILIEDTTQNISSLIRPDAIYTPVLYQTSQASNKKNFEPMKGALDIIKDIDIYKYNMKYEDDEVKKHIGFVIGENFKHSKEITSKEDDNVDIYSFVSLCCKAIQEQQEQIEELKKEITKLKEGK